MILQPNDPGSAYTCQGGKCRTAQMPLTTVELKTGHLSRRGCLDQLSRTKTASAKGLRVAVFRLGGGHIVQQQAVERNAKVIRQLDSRAEQDGLAAHGTVYGVAAETGQLGEFPALDPFPCTQHRYGRRGVVSCFHGFL